jgi:glucose-6-phosphate dehydrogenase assembly protein OpcA
MSEPGLPVEIGQIDKELGRLWDSSDDTKTRASLLNLVIYSEDPDSMQTNTELLATIASQHAFRAILIIANPGAETPLARAWISAHCHLAGMGGRQICSEQITFQLDGESADSLPSIVFSHLDSDLPLCFWSQAEFRKPLDEQLWSWVDRLIFDSATWKDPDAQFALTRDICSLADGRSVLCDLNWTRLRQWRFALANVFDHPSVLTCIPAITGIRIDCGSEDRVKARLLFGWLCAQLGWNHEPEADVLHKSDGSAVAFEIPETPGSGITNVEFCGAGFCVGIRRTDSSALFHVSIQIPGIPVSTMILGAGRDRPSDTLLAELGRGGRHPLYTKALNACTASFAGPLCP